MYDADVRDAALAAIRSGQSLAAVSRATGISRSAMRSWRDGTRGVRISECPRCGPVQRLPAPGAACRAYRAFLRGLFHSDGCRLTNWTRRTVADTPRRYEYPRWFFTNTSADILGLCSAGLERLGIPHRFPRPDMISVARREAVAALDALVGPKA